MKRLPHWVITDKFPALYDSESATAIEQTAKLYGAMNELIDNYNQFVDNINTHIEEFKNGVNTDYEMFKISLRQEFQDFIDVIDLKITKLKSNLEEWKTEEEEFITSTLNNIRENMNEWKTVQENEFNALQLNMDNWKTEKDQEFTAWFDARTTDIIEAIDYMKTNLHQSLYSLLQEMRDNGEMTQAIYEAFDNLDQKLENYKTELTEQLQTDKNDLLELIESIETELKHYVDERIKFVTPQMFGAVGDGITNDTQAFIDALNVSRSIYVPRGNYLVTPEHNPHLQLYYENITPSGIWIHEDNTQMIFEEGATLICDTINQNEWNFYAVICVRGKGDNGQGAENARIKNVTIDGATIIGARSQYDSSSIMENGLGINISYADNVTIKNCAISDNMGDSIFTYASDNIKIFNCTSRRSRRGAISIGSCDGFLIDGCDFAEEEQTVTYPNGNTSTGTNPNAIICIENDSYGDTTGTHPRNIIIRNNIFNQGDAPYSFLAGNGQGGAFGGWENVLIENNIFYNVKSPYSVFVNSSKFDEVFTGKDLTVRNNTFELNCVVTVNACAVFCGGCEKVVIDNNHVINGIVAHMDITKIIDIKNNHCDYGVFARWYSDSTSDIEVVNIINNTGHCGNIITNYPHSARKLTMKGNHFDGLRNEFDTNVCIIFSANIDVIEIIDNVITSPYAVFINKTIEDEGELLLKGNTFKFTNANDFYWTGSGNYFKATIINNYFETAKLYKQSVGNFTQKMTVINNVFAGACDSMVTDAETTDYVTLVNNIHIS